MPTAEQTDIEVATAPPEDYQTIYRAWAQACVDSGLADQWGASYKANGDAKVTIRVGRHDNRPVKGIAPKILAAYKNANPTQKAEAEKQG